MGESMLVPGEFFVGCIGDATSGLTLLLPRGKYEETILITHAPDTPHAVFLSGQFEFTSFECINSDAWKGILIPNVAIEIDHESILDSESLYAPVGGLVRQGTQLDMVTRFDGALHRTTRTKLATGLPSSRANMSAGFAKWRIVIGEGPTKRELKRIEVGQ